MQAGNALASPHIFAGSSEPSLIDNVISTEISCAGSYHIFLSCSMDIGVVHKVYLYFNSS